MKTIYTILFFLTLGGVAYAQFPAAFQSYSYLVGNGTFQTQGTSSPTVGYLTATSTIATSTFLGSVKIGNSFIGTTSPFQITATTTPATPASATHSLAYGSGNYTAGGTYNLITYWIYPYVIVDGVKIFSATPAKTTTTSDNGSFQHFKVNVSWSTVTGVVGYRVMIYDEDIEGTGENTNGRNPYCTEGQGGGNCTRYTYYDTTGTSFVDGDGTEALYLFSNNPTKQGVVLPNVSGSDLYVRGDTGDLYSPNGGYFGKTSIGTVTVYRKNRQVVYYNATNTDSYSYGVALTTATNDIQAGDLIILKSGTYLISQTQYLADGVCLIGQGKGNTILKSENMAFQADTNPSQIFTFSFLNFPFSAYTGCVKEMTIDTRTLGHNVTTPIVIDGSSGNTASSTFLIENVETIGEIDGIFVYNYSNNDMKVDIINWNCNTKWDCFNATNITNKTTVNVRDSTLICKGPDVSITTGSGCSPWATRSNAQPLLTENLYNTLIWAQGGGVIHDVGVEFQTYTGNFNLYNSEIRTDATSTTDVASHIVLNSASPVITSFHSYFNPNKITNELGVKTNTTVYGSTLSTTTGMYLNGNLGIRTTSSAFDLSVNGLSLFSTTTLNACSAEADSTEGSIYSGCNSTLGPLQIISNRTDNYGSALDSVWGGYGDNGSGVRNGNWITAGTTTFNGPVIVNLTHAAAGLTVIGGNSLFGTSTSLNNNSQLIIATSTGQNLSLVDPSGSFAIWNFKNCGGTLCISTSSPITGATTSPTALSLNSNGTRKFGIGTTSPFATFSLVPATSTVPLNISSTTVTFASSTLFEIDQAGTIITGGSVPVVSCAATCALDGHSNDQAGTINISGVQTSVTVTFSVPKPWSPHCTISDSSTGATADISTLNTTTLTVSFSASIGTASVYYICQN